MKQLVGAAMTIALLAGACGGESAVRPDSSISVIHEERDGPGLVVEVANLTDSWLSTQLKCDFTLVTGLGGRLELRLPPIPAQSTVRIDVVQAYIEQSVGGELISDVTDCVLAP